MNSIEHRPGRSRRTARVARRGFTLVEIIVVVTIIALLAGLIVPRIWGRVSMAKETRAKSDASSIASQVKLYLLDEGLSRLDPDFELSALRLSPEDGGGPSGPYLEKDDDLIDPWGTAYDIRIPGDVNTDFDVVSAGEDKQFNTEDDITN